MRRSLNWCLCSTLGLALACSAEQLPYQQPLNAQQAETSECQIPSDAFSNLPQEVLAGTDLKPLDSIVASKQAIALKAKYTMEMGGAELLLALTKKDSRITFKREYREPGMPPEVKHYAELCFKNNRVYGEHVRALVVENGLLWLELDSGNDFIPGDFWLFFE